MALRGSDEDIRFVIRAIDDGGFRLLERYQRMLKKIRTDEADFRRSGQLRDDRGRFLSREASLRVIEAKKLREEQNKAFAEQERRIRREEGVRARFINNVRKAERAAYEEQIRRNDKLQAATTRRLRNEENGRAQFINRVRRSERDAYAEDARRDRQRQAGIQRMGRLHAQALAEDARRSRARGLPGGNTPAAFNNEIALWGRLRTAVLAYFGARAAGRVISGFVREGIQFNQLIETATLGVATIITASAELRDDQGKAVKGAQALAGAYGLAEEQLQKIRIAGLQTAATTEQLAEAFQQATGPGLAAGLNLDQIRKITIQIVQAAGAIGVPFNQLNQEVRSILAATIDRNSRIAKTLLITNEQVKQAQQQNRLAEFLNQKLEAFTVAGQKAAGTMFVLKSNLKETLQVFAGTATKTLFDKLKVSLQGLLLGTFDFTTLQISSKFTGILDAMQAMFGSIGDLIGIGLRKAVDGAEALSGWFREHKSQVGQIVEGFFEVTKAVGRIIRDSALFLGQLIGASAETGDMAAVLKNITGILDAINRNGRELLAIFIGIKLASIAMSAQFVAFLAVTQKHPVILVLTTLVGLLTAVRLAAQSATIAQDAYRRSQNDLVVSIANAGPKQLTLVEQYADLTEKLTKLKEGTDEYKGVQDKIVTVTNELKRINPGFISLLEDEKIARDDILIAMRADTLLRRQSIDAILQTAQAKLAEAKANVELARSDPLARIFRATIGKLGIFGSEAPLVSNAEEKVETAQKFVDDLIDVLSAWNKAARGEDAPLTPFRLPPALDDKDGKIRNQLEEANRKRLQVIQADIDKRKALLEEDVADEVITRQQFNADMAALITEQKNREISSYETLRSDLKRIKKLTAEDGKLIDADIEIATSEHVERLADLRRRAARDLLKEARAAAKEQTSAAAQAVLDAQAAIKDANEQVTAQIGRGEISKAEGSAFVAAVIEKERAKVEVALESLRDLRRLLTEPLPAGTDQGTLGAFKKLGEAILPNLDKQITNTETVIGAMTGAMNKANLAADAFQIEIGKILQTGITGFFNDLVTGTKSVSDAFRDMALSIVNSIASIIAQTVAWSIVNSILPGAAGVKPAAAGFLGGSGPTLRAASGGFVRGPGTGTSDSVAARLSAGEYVLRADRVKDIGVDVLDAINFGLSRPNVRGKRSFATGGLVDAAAGGSGGIAALRVGLDRGLILEVLKSPEGGRVLVRHAARNRNKLRQVVR